MIYIILSTHQKYHIRIAVRGIDSLSEEELRLLSRGAQMWEKGSTAQKMSLGILGDLMNIIAAVSGLSMNLLLISSG